MVSGRRECTRVGGECRGQKGKVCETEMGVVSVVVGVSVVVDVSILFVVNGRRECTARERGKGRGQKGRYCVRL